MRYLLRLSDGRWALLEYRPETWVLVLDLRHGSPPQREVLDMLAGLGVEARPADGDQERWGRMLVAVGRCAPWDLAGTSGAE